MRIPILAIVGLLLAAALASDAATNATLPVREITVFKDNHAFLLREGQMPVSSSGDVVLDELPIPEFGTFFPYSGQQSATLSSVVSEYTTVTSPKSAQSIPELLEANPGANVEITTGNNEKFDATVIGIPTTTAQTGNAPTSAPTGSIILLKTAGGTRAFPIANIASLLFKDHYRPDVHRDDRRGRLTLHLDWRGKASSTAAVGMVYLQKGIRWVPEYKITIDGKGDAHVHLQATLVNDIGDLNDVTANLVIGVPSFAYAGITDPVALQETLGQLSPYLSGQNRSLYALSNSVETQLPGAYADRRDDGSSPPNVTVTGGGRAEDLFVYTVQHVTLKKGQVMVVPVSDYHVKYTDVYTLDLPYTPPQDARQYIDYNTLDTLKKAAGVRVMHNIRLVNSYSAPFTTAPALLLRGDRVISQSTMDYTPVGGSVDLNLSTAVNVPHKRSDHEAKSTPDAITWQGYQYARVDIEGKVEVTNYETSPIDLEVTRNVFGRVDTATNNGVIETFDSVDADGPTVNGSNTTWWDHLNGYGKITWKVRVAPKDCAKLGYTWHYFWR